MPSKTASEFPEIPKRRCVCPDALTTGHCDQSRVAMVYHSCLTFYHGLKA
jgi:hypothetical protein